MRKRTLDSYIKQSYETYLRKLSDLNYKNLEIRGNRFTSMEAVSYEEYKHSYKYYRNEGFDTSKFSAEFLKSQLAFSYEEAMKMVSNMKSLGGFNEEVFSDLGFDLKHNKNGTVNTQHIVHQIMAMSGEEAHTFVTELIDKGYYSSGDAFEYYTY